MSVIKDVTIKIYDNGGWRLYACATGGSITFNTSFIETSTTGSGIWQTVAMQKHSCTGTLNGIVNLDTPGKLTLADLRQRQFAMTLLFLSYEREDGDGNFYTEQLYVYITSSSDSKDINSANTFNIDFIANGAATQIFTPTNLNSSNVRRYQGTFAGGETTLSIPSLANKDILDVHKDGIGNCAIITSGSPVDKEVLYDTNGDFTWYIPGEPGETFYILYQDI